MSAVFVVEQEKGQVENTLAASFATYESAAALLAVLCSTPLQQGACFPFPPALYFFSFHNVCGSQRPRKAERRLRYPYISATRSVAASS